jgi:hypothetical protein
MLSQAGNSTYFSSQHGPLVRRSSSTRVFGVADTEDLQITIQNFLAISPLQGLCDFGIASFDEELFQSIIPLTMSDLVDISQT